MAHGLLLKNKQLKESVKQIEAQAENKEFYHGMLRLFLQSSLVNELEHIKIYSVSKYFV